MANGPKNPTDDPFRPMLRTAQLVAGSLVFGLLSFFGVVGYLVVFGGFDAAPPNEDLPVVSLTAGVFLVFNIAVALVLPQVQTQAALRRIAASKPPGVGLDLAADAPLARQLLGLYQSAMILSLAPIEAAGFLAGIAYLIERQPLVLLVAGMALGLMVAKFPSPHRVETWLQRQAERLAELAREGDGNRP